MNTDKTAMNSDGRVIIADKHKRYKYGELTGSILNAAFEVHNSLGCGFLEKVYEKALSCELKEKKVNFREQVKYKVSYKGKDVGVYVADIVVEGKIIVEIKVVSFLTNIHSAQTLNYLKASGNEVALILNFAKPKLEYKRMVL